jgi:F0F1-type ATP synthase membrane subunit b/b'
MAAMMLVPLSGGSLVDLDATFLIQLGLFFFMFLFLYALLFRPAIRLIEARREATDGTRTRAAAMLDEARHLSADVDGQIRDIREAARAERDRTVEEARRKERQQLEEARTHTRATLDEARARMEREAAAVRKEIEAGIPALAALVADQVLGRTVRQ